MKILNIPFSLNQPYPYYYGHKSLHQLSLTILFLCTAFIYFFEPFIVYPPEQKMPFILICLVHGLNPALVLYVFFTGINLFLKDERRWTLGKEIIALVSCLLIIGIASFLKRDIIYNNPLNWSYQYFFEEIRNTYLVGSLLIIILVPLNFMRLFVKNNQEVKDWKLEPANKPIAHTNEVEIKTLVKSDEFAMNLMSFLFAKAEGNYVEFYFSKDGGFRKELKRVSFKEVERQLSPYTFIVKTHRSYLVNRKKVINISGNAQGYQLEFANYPETIPVSRGMIKVFQNTLKEA